MAQADSLVLPVKACVKCHNYKNNIMVRSRAWVFTLNNYDEDEEGAIALLGAEYTVYGKEVGEQSTPHLQGYVYFKSARSLKSLKKKLPRAHWEVRRGTHEQARAYCVKDGNVVEYGNPPQKNGGDSQLQLAKKNKRLRDADLNELVENGEISIMVVRKLKLARLDLAQEAKPYVAEGVRGIWLWGPPGTGKTHYARSTWGDAYYVKPQNKWFDGYIGQKTIVLDDLDKLGVCLGHYLKIWADKWSCTGEVKGGQVNLVHDRFVVTSNYSIEELWMEDEEMQKAIRRRFKVKHFSELK